MPVFEVLLRKQLPSQLSVLIPVCSTRGRHHGRQSYKVSRESAWMRSQKFGLMDDHRLFFGGQQSVTLFIDVIPVIINEFDVLTHVG